MTEPVPPIPLSPAERDYQAFLRAAKLYWAGPMYQALRRRYSALGLDEANPDQAERELRGESGYAFFSWLERYLQQAKYASPRGLVAIVERQRPALEQALAAATRAGEASGRLLLDAGLDLPDWYIKTDYHQHPGGVWSDELAGFVYELGRRTTLPAHLDPWAVHDLFTAAVPDGDYRRILDLGCGTGRSQFPFGTRWPGAELHGIDLAAPCLKLAHLNGRELGIEAWWAQRRCEATGYPDGHFDLLHSTFLLHELPRKSVEALVDEAFRVLTPGGRFVHLDFHSPPGGNWGAFIHYGPARRNNEVFMRSFCETDFLALERQAGFIDVAMLPFDDGTGLPGPDGPQRWRFPFQLFVATRPG